MPLRVTLTVTVGCRQWCRRCLPIGPCCRMSSEFRCDGLGAQPSNKFFSFFTSRSLTPKAPSSEFCSAHCGILSPDWKLRRSRVSKSSHQIAHHPILDASHLFPASLLLQEQHLLLHDRIILQHRQWSTRSRPDVGLEVSRHRHAEEPDSYRTRLGYGQCQLFRSREMVESR